MDNLFTRFLVSERIKLRPHELNGAFEDTILLRLRERCEGKCTRNGYVRRGSVRTFKISPGQLESNSLNGDVVFAAVFECDACNPARGQTLTATVRNFNKFGVMASAGTRDADDRGGFSHVLSIIIPKHSSTGGAQSVADLDAVAVGDKLVTEIVGVKYELNDPRISVIGRALQHIPQGSDGAHGTDAPPSGSGQGPEAAAATATAVQEDVEDLVGDDLGSEDIDDEEETIAAAALAASAPDPDPYGEGEDDNEGEDDDGEDDDDGAKARNKRPAATSAANGARGSGSAPNRKARRDEGVDEDDSGLDEESDEEQPDEEEEDEPVDEELGSDDESDAEPDADTDTDSVSAAAATTSRKGEMDGKRTPASSKPLTTASAGRRSSNKLPPGPAPAPVSSPAPGPAPGPDKKEKKKKKGDEGGERGEEGEQREDNDDKKKKKKKAAAAS